MNHQEMYEAAFNAKVEQFREKDFYPQLREQADKALNWHTGGGLIPVQAQDFINRIIVIPAAEIEQWAKGESLLTWPQAAIDYGIEKAVVETYLRYAESRGVSLSPHDKDILGKGGFSAMDETAAGGTANAVSQNNDAPAQVSEPAQSANAPLMENQYVQELFSIMQDNGKDTKGLAELIGRVGEMEGFVTRAEQKIADMKSQLAEMKEAQGHPVRTALQSAIKALETKVAEVKERISELKTAIIDGCKTAVEAFKEKGAAALSGIAKFFHIKSALKAIDKTADSDIATCDRAVANINKFAQNYHEVGRGVKNMGLIIIGREPVDQKKENGKLAAAMALPYKAHKAALNGIKKAIGAMEKGLAQLDASVESQRAGRAIEKNPAERKMGIIGELEANIAMLAAQDRERAVPDKSRQKEAAL
jgi:hypothetical protein